MKLKYVIAVALFFAVPSARPQGQPQAHQRRADTKTATITSHTALPITTSGAEKIIVQYVNPLHYQYYLQATSSNISAPTPPSSIAPSASIGGTLPPPPPPTSVTSTNVPRRPGTQPPTVDEQWQNILNTLKVARETLFDLKQETDRSLFVVSMEEQCYKDRLSFYSSFLLDDDTANLLKQFVRNNVEHTVSGPGSNSASESCRRPDDTWPFDGLQANEKQLYQLQADVFDLASVNGFATWKNTAPNGDNYIAVTTFIGNLITEVQALEVISDVAKNFQAAQVYNHFWRVKVEDIARSEADISRSADALERDRVALQTQPNNTSLKTAYANSINAYIAARQRSPLLLTVYVDCSTNWYGRGRTDTITLHYTDITATSPSDQNTQIAVSSCLTPGTVSTGIGMSFLRNRQFAFVSGRDPNNPANTISVIGTTTDQQVTPLYAVQYNIALKDSSKGLGLHAAVGAALGSSSGTANIELIAGPSISIHRRAFFITPAFQLGRRDELLPGFAVGNAQGNGLTAIPVHTSWKPGFALTFSFSVAQ